MNQLYDFFMDELYRVTEFIDNDCDVAHEVCITLSLSDGAIPETFYRLYTSRVSIDPITMINAASYFAGIGAIQVDCDCSPENMQICEINGMIDNLFYRKGMEDCASGADDWVNTIARIDELKLEIG